VPTETFYALAADPLSEPGVERVRALKGRDGSKPLLVLFAEREQLAPLGVAASEDVIDRYLAIWPAPLTVILPIVRPIPASLGALSLGVRMPAHSDLRALIARTGPLTGTSWNRAGESPRADPDEPGGADEIDLLVDGGKTAGGAPSTLLDATVSPPRVLREGAFRWPPESR
jgi:L-threonylcarbamoyladenylate synthase